jgi:hypothetical protein
MWNEGKNDHKRLSVLENPTFWDVMLCYWASSLYVLWRIIAPYSLVLEEGWRIFLGSRAQIVYKFRRNSLMCLWEFWREKKRSLSLPKCIALILMCIIVYNKGLIEEWDKKKCFSQLRLLLLRIWREDCKMFCPMSRVYGFLPEEGTDRFRNVGKKLPLLATQ